MAKSTTKLSLLADNFYNSLFHNSCKPSNISADQIGCAKQYNQCVMWCRKRKLKDHSTTEMVPMTLAIKPNVNTCIQSTRGKRHQHKSLRKISTEKIWQHFNEHSLRYSPICHAPKVMTHSRTKKNTVQSSKTP